MINSLLLKPTNFKAHCDDISASTVSVVQASGCSLPELSFSEVEVKTLWSSEDQREDRSDPKPTQAINGGASSCWAVGLLAHEFL